MIQLSTFRHAKGMARYPLGNGAEAAHQYWSDTRRQWEDSHDPRKLFALVGSQNVPAYRTADLKQAVGELTPAEVELKAEFETFYKTIPPTLTSLPVTLDLETDFLETVFDLRQIQPYLGKAKRIVDLGPGAGRHMVGLTLGGYLKSRNYVGLEAIGLPYVLQSALGGRLAGNGRIGGFGDFLDFQFARQPFPAECLGANAIAHLPMWEDAQIPEHSADLVICSYLLDEVSPDDFIRLVATIDRILAPGGVLYCRGSQERALRTNFNHYGYGHHHGQDITRALTGIGLVATQCGLVVDTVNRVFVRPAPGANLAPAAPFGTHDSDVTLVDALNEAFLESVLDELAANQARVVVWGEPGHRRYQEILERFRSRTNVVGMTSRSITAQAVLPNGLTDYPTKELAALNPDAVLFLSYRFPSFYRELREIMPAGSFGRMRHFQVPVAIAYR